MFKMSASKPKKKITVKHAADAKTPKKAAAKPKVQSVSMPLEDQIAAAAAEAEKVQEQKVASATTPKKIAVTMHEPEAAAPVEDAVPADEPAPAAEPVETPVAAAASADEPPEVTPTAEPVSPADTDSRTDDEIVVQLDHGEAATVDASDEPAETEAAVEENEPAEDTAADEAEEPPTSPMVDGAEVPEEPVDETLPAATGTDTVDATEPANPENPIDINKEMTIEEAEAAAKQSADEFSDEDTEAVVDDIVEKESDTVLAADDADIAKAFVAEKPKFGTRVKRFFGRWWDNPIARWSTIIAVPLILIALAVVPVTRYFFLNLFGAHAGTSVTVLDESTQQPLKNVQLRVRGQTTVTDTDGKASLSNLELGKTEVAIEKPGFAPYQRSMTLGWGSNPQGDVKLQPVGTQFTFVLKDWLSGKPVAKAEATSGSASAVSNDDGKLVITLDKVADTDVEISIAANTYRTEKQSLKPGDKSEHALTLVPARKHVFISKRSGKYDVYKIDVDGKNETKIVSGTGSERNDMVLVPHPTADVVAMVSTRDNQRNKDGFLLSSLYLIDVNSSELTRLTLSERVQVVDWVDGRLVYVTIAQGVSGGNPKRTHLVSYDKDSENSTELATANYFNDVLVAKGTVYYAPSSAAVPESAAKLFKVNADGTGKQTILDKEAWNMFRTDHDKLSVSVQQDWYDYKLGETSAKKTAGPPAELKTRVYRDNPAGGQSIRADERDGKGVLLLLNIADGKETIIQTKAGLKNPIAWLNPKYVIFRVAGGQETADYVQNIDGGEAKKIKDVTDTGGVDAWYYY